MASIALTSKDLARRTIERRAIEALIWGMPAVNHDLMFQAFTRLKGAANQIVYWSRLSDWKNQTLTPNPDAVYLMSFFDTKDVGPIVLEIPPADDGVINGSVMDCWQSPFEDVGPAGFDKGKGGKYLILPPGYVDAIPPGYFAMPSNNYRGYALLRSILRSGSAADIEQAVAYGKRIRLYPLAQAGNAPPTRFVDAIGSLFDSIIPYDVRFFESLHRVVQIEPWLARDRAMIELLKSLGIEKGRPFKPDAGTQRVLKQAAVEAHAWLEDRYAGAFTPPFFPGTHWAVPASPEVIEGVSSSYAEIDKYPTGERGVLYSFAFFCARHLGAGQFYLMTIVDKRGRPFDGGKTYRLHVPANAPVKQFWSATAYDRATHALIRNRPWSSRSSQSPGLQEQSDGSVDVYFGAKAPAGMKSNWVPTRAGGQFEVLFRLYGPDKSFFEKKWTLPDIELVR